MHENNHDELNDLYKKNIYNFTNCWWMCMMLGHFVNINQLYEVERLKTDDEKMLYLVPVVL
jgi:hypothetical protein